MAAIAIGTLTDIEKTSYVKEALAFAKFALIYRQFGSKEEVAERDGKTRQWFRFDIPAVTSGSDFTGAATYVKNTTGAAPTFTPATPTDTVITATADYLYGKGHEWSSPVAYTSFTDIKANLRAVNAEHAGRSVDTEVRDTIKVGTTVQYSHSKTSRGLLTSGDQIVMNDIFDSVTTLRNNSARPIKGMMSAMHSHNVTAQLMKDTAFQSAIQFQKPYIFEGTIAEIYGVRFTPTENAPAVANSGSNNAVGNVEQTLIAADGGYGVTYWMM
ncbi:MAG: N4-gp56 family major capsid protein, partial [Bacteroidota bacterium]|nr:N4-gp56 family major capsid protein [Bacteroidota bacterium]